VLTFVLTFGTHLVSWFFNKEILAMSFKENISNWWRPKRYQVEYFKDSMHLSYFDEQVCNSLSEAIERLDYINNLSDEAKIKWFGFCPFLIRISCITEPNPLRRFLNRCGSKRLYRIGRWQI
jgi:hypothetical protein